MSKSLKYEAPDSSGLLKTLERNVKYDEKAKPVEILCPECGHPTGEFLQPHAKDCPCAACTWERDIFAKRISPGSKTITFRKFSNIGSDSS